MAMPKAPSRMPERRPRPPELRLTNVAPMVPAPGMPPRRAVAPLPIPWASSSRFASLRLPVITPRTTQVLRVSMERRTARVAAGTMAESMAWGVRSKRPVQCLPRLVARFPAEAWITPMTMWLSLSSSIPGKARPNAK